MPLPNERVTSGEKIRRLFSIAADDPHLLRAQFEAFSKQIPLLYFILSANSLAVAYTFSSLAPLWLSVYLPGVLCSFCLIRCVWWWRQRHHVPDDAQVLRAMRMTGWLAPGLSVAFTVWGLSLYRYGDPYAQGHVAFYMALTVIGCIFCLMHLRSAALSVTLLVNVPFIVFFFFEGHATMKAIAINLALVCAAMITILMVYYRDFANLVASRRSLIEKQAETQSLSDENFRLANLDSLSGLPNRRWFFAHLEQYHAAVAPSRKPFAVGIIDLDGFKPVNDTYGHATGDRLLLEMGQRLQDIMTPGAGEGISLARLGGDEFAMIVKGDVTPEALKVMGERVAHLIRLPFSIGSVNVQVGCSIGFALYPQSADTPEILFERADYALYFAKRQRRGETVMFSSEHEAQIRNDCVIDQALQGADLERELSMVYQPIVEIGTGRVLAFEALARWHSPTLGHIPPSVFIPAAERNGLIRKVTRTLLTKALNAAREWPEDVRLSFNLSAHDLSSPEMLIHLIALINQSGLSARRLDFEVTETAVVQDFTQARTGIEALKALGVGISLDDFGTGYSSLSHLHKLPLDKLKIDQSFVADIISNPASLKIVKSLTALCADMGLQCIVEGVETEAQIEILSGLGCGMAQGYFFARPMSADRVAAYLNEAGVQPERKVLKA